MRVVRWLLLIVVLAAVAGSIWVLQQRRLGSPVARYLGPAVVTGALSERPILFASAVHLLVPRTAAAIEGRLTVPQNRGRADGRTVDLHYLRFAATAANTGAATFYLEDGPGAAASRVIAGARFAFLQQLRAAGDVVVVDHRGTYFSPPTLQCAGRLDFPLEDEATPENRAEAVTPYLRSCAREVSAEADLGTFNTRESARDLDDLRVALGLDRINVVGVGYGSQLALEYARLFPNHVASIVAVGLEAPHQIYKLPSQIDPALARIAAAAAVRYPNLLHDLAQVLDALESAPVRVVLDIPGRPEITLGRVDFEAWLYAAAASRAGIATIPRAVGRALQGDYRDMARTVAAARAPSAWSLTPIAFNCSAGLSIGRAEQVLVESELALLRYVPSAMLNAVCRGWPAPRLPADFRYPIESNVDILAVVGTLDVHTSLEAVEEALEGLPHATVVTVEGAARGEDLLVEAGAVAELAVQFLRKEVLAVERIVLAPIGFLPP